MESSAALPHAARELLLKGGGCAVNFECAPELCAPLRAELARSGRSVGFVRADEGFYDRMAGCHDRAARGKKQAGRLPPGAWARQASRRLNHGFTDGA